MAEPLRRVGRYELVEVIGRGGTAAVYLAHQPDLDRRVAVKELSAHHAGDPRFAERFVEESRLIGALNHPNIVTVHEFFEHDGLPYIAMEYLPRGSLRAYLRALSLPQVFGIAENVLDGLTHGESHGVVHRDLKPENLLVSGDGEVKIADYGVARALDTVVPRAFATMTGTAIGTPAYMAPEQALGEKLGPEADLYSLGVIVWEALAGRPPFGNHDTPMAVLYQKIHEPVPRITELEPDVDPGLANWLDTIMAKSPDERFHSAAEAWDQLEEVAIRLLGPRWRREAKITLELDRDVEFSGGILPTVGDSDPGAGRSPSTPPTRQRDTPLPGAARVTPTPTPQLPEPAMATMMRLSRRHDALEEAAPETDAASRRWRLWAAAGLAVVVAAVAGIGVGIGTNKSAPAAQTLTETTPTTALAAAVRPALSTLATAQQRGVKTLAKQRTRAAQASAATAVKNDYKAAATSLAALPATERKLASAKSLTTTVAALEKDWFDIARSAKAGNAKAYDSARGAATRDAQRLASVAATTAQG